MKNSSMVLSALSLGCLFIHQSAQATILPPNDLHLEDTPSFTANITEEEFGTLIDEVVELYQPLAALHGAELQAKKLWDNSTVNASAQQMGKLWLINMYGGLARRPEVTQDGFSMVVCHELGHHFGGFPFSPMSWAADEGQSDYFATQTCARALWRDQAAENAEFASTVHPEAKFRCDSAWSEEAERNLCYRIAEAGLSLSTLLAALNRQPLPDFSTPSEKVVRRTNHTHPAAQCRLDTYLAGALCTVLFEPRLIPGKGRPFFLRGGKKAEAEAMMVSCDASRQNQLMGSRPACWFRARTFDPVEESLVAQTQNMPD